MVRHQRPRCGIQADVLLLWNLVGKEKEIERQRKKEGKREETE